MTFASTSNRSGARLRRTAALCAAAALALSAAPARAGDEEGCLGCHGLAGLAVRDAGQARALGVLAAPFDASAHGVLGCRDCHVDIASIPHGERREPGCGLSCHGQIAEGREYSHEGLYWEFATSSHGASKSRKVGCLVCHPEPARPEGAERDKLAEARRCAACHRDSAAVRDWFSDRHFLALAGGNRRAPSCPDCHSSHRVRPAAAAESPVNPKRLVETCSNGAVEGDRRGACHGVLAPAAVSGARMSPLRRGRPAEHPAAHALALLAGALLGALVLRAGVGLVRGR